MDGSSGGGGGLAHFWLERGYQGRRIAGLGGTKCFLEIPFDDRRSVWWGIKSISMSVARCMQQSSFTLCWTDVLCVYVSRASFKLTWSSSYRLGTCNSGPRISSSIRILSPSSSCTTPAYTPSHHSRSNRQTSNTTSRIALNANSTHNLPSPHASWQKY
jgi:hypothetical protein